ncbi:MAG: hypothetical protein IKI40_07850 [Treponema sp.]|nr:hypothetical protein [Treponema sp.]
MIRQLYKYLSGICLAFIFSASFVFAQQGQVSTQVHDGSVAYIVPCENSTAFISAGSDGNVIKWTQNGKQEHYQMSSSPLLKLQLNPKNNDFVTTEADSFGIYRMTVSDWSTFAKKYSKQFKDPIESVSYSAKGSLLFVTTSAVNGSYILNANTGNLIKRIDSVSSKISLVQTADSEKSAMFYCESGDIYYFNLQKMELFEQPHWKTESSLKQTQTFGSGNMKNRFLAGVKKDTVYIIDSQTGKTVCSYKGPEPHIVVSNKNKTQGLYFTVLDGSKINLMHYPENAIAAKASGNGASPTPKLIASFTGIGSNLSSVACQNDSTFMFGTDKGNLYSTVNNGSSLSLSSLTKETFESIIDIAGTEDSVLLLTKDSLYSTSYDKKELTKVAKSNGADKITLVNDSSAVLWTKKARKDVYLVTFSEENPKSGQFLFTPKGNVNNLHVFGRKLIYVSGGSRVYIFDLDTKRENLVYTGVSIEDSIIVNSNTIYVAKANTGNKDSSVISVGINSKETLALKTPGFIAFDLFLDSGKSGNLYGITLESIGSSTVTHAFSFNSAERKSMIMFQHNQEDSESFIKVEYPVVYSNLGNNQIYAYDVESGRTKIYRRTASAPVKMAMHKDKFICLNADGGLTWYKVDSLTPISQCYLTSNNELVEF